MLAFRTRLSTLASLYFWLISARRFNKVEFSSLNWATLVYEKKRSQCISSADYKRGMKALDKELLARVNKHLRLELS